MVAHSGKVDSSKEPGARENSASDSEKVAAFSFVTGHALLVADNDRGLVGRLTSSDRGPAIQLFSENAFLRDINFGSLKLLSYKSKRGADLTALVVLPPDYSPGKRTR